MHPGTFSPALMRDTRFVEYGPKEFVYGGYLATGSIKCREEIRFSTYIQPLHLLVQAEVFADFRQ
jgi:hypothetical protein